MTNFAEKVNDKINDLVLQKYPEQGNFYTSGVIDSSNIAIKVDDKTFLFPIEQEGLDLLKNKCQPAVFGKGTETIYDDSVRKCLQLKKEEIGNIKIINYQHNYAEGLDHYLNPINVKYPRNFDRILDDIRDSIVDKLNITEKLSFEFHDLVIYEKSDFFKEHTDTEKQENMIGTLVISLPNPHSGGMMKVKHADREECFTSDLDSTKISWCAFYADCKHEVFPVREGTRITLVYNIILNSDKKIGDDIVENPELNQLVKNYLDKSKIISCKTYLKKTNQLISSIDYPINNLDYRQEIEKKFINDNLIFILEHYYSEHGFKYNLLKNRDKYIVDLLYSVAQSNDLDFKLGLANIKEVWDTYEGGHEDGYALIQQRSQSMKDCNYLYTDFEISYILDPVTFETDNWLSFESKNLLSLKDTFLYDANIEGESYQGNWGGDITRQYKRAVVVLTRKNNVG